MDQNRPKARISAFGSYVPEQVLSNEDLEKMVDTSDEWIVQRTGIKERRIAEKNQAASDLGIEAAERSLSNSLITAKDIDLVIAATMTPDYISPSTASLIQKGIGATNAAAFDVGAACSGYIYGLATAKAYVESGLYKNILFVATEKMSAFIDYQDRSTCVLFGDGASACLITDSGPGFLIDSVYMGADGNYYDLIIIPSGGSRSPVNESNVCQKENFLKMQGAQVFKHAVRQMANSIEKCMSASSVRMDQMRFVIFHQANIRMMDSVSKKLSIPPEKVWRTIHKYGNTSASSIGLALEEVVDKKHLNTGDSIVLTAAGAGLTWGSACLRKTDS